MMSGEPSATRRLARVLACWPPDWNAVRACGAAGASVDTWAGKKRTVLMRAARDGCDDVAEMVLARGAQVDRIDEVGMTALMHAAWGGHAALIRRLIAAGAPIETLDDGRWSALVYAAWHGREQAVSTLVACGARSDVLNAHRWAALLQMTDDPRSIGPLFACGGDPLIGAGATGDCALDVWLRRGRDDLVAALDVALARALGATDGGAVCDRAMRVLEVPAARASLPRCQAVLTALCRADKWKRAVARGLPMDGVIV